MSRNIKNTLRARIGTIATLFIICELFCVSCDKEEQLPADLKWIKESQWKLAGIVDMETDVLSELEPKDCEECYTLTFDKKGKITAFSIWAIYRFNLIEIDKKERNICNPDNYHTGKNKQKDCLHAEAKDGITYEDSYLFRQGIVYAKTYEIEGEELKLFYTRPGYGTKHYLLFTPFTIKNNNKWNE